ncbi:MAG: VCBS repeat-containing protein [Bacteroidales bacterium]|nr:VCBS repeat-containing protein [Bacteroidales bacterium]
MKKTVIALLIILILGGTGAYFYLKKQQIPEYNIIKLISNNSAFFIDIQSPVKFLNNLTKDNAIWNEITQISSVKNFKNKVGTIDSLVRSDKQIKDLLRKNRLIIMAEKQGKERLEFSFLLKLNNLREQNHVLNYLKQWGNSRNHKLKSKNYNKTKLFSIRQKDSHKLSWATVKGILIVSTSPLLVEKSIRQSSVENTLVNNKHFKKVSEIAGKNVAANIYINFENFPEVISLPLDTPYQTYIKSLTNFGRWSILDINLKSDILLLNGFTLQDGDKNEVIDLLIDQKPVKLGMESILPSNTAAYISLGINKKKNYRKNLHELYRDKKVFGDYREWMAKIEDQYNFNPEEAFYDMLHQEIGIAFMNPDMKHPRDKAFIIMKTEDKKYVQSKLSQISKEVSSEAGNSHVQKISINEETQYPVYKLPIDNLFNHLFGDIFQGISNRYFTLIGQYAVFGGSQDLLREFIYSNVLNKTLNYNKNHQEFSEYFSNRSNFHFYTNMYRSPSLVSNFLKTDLQKGLRKNKEHFRKFQALACQLMGNGDMIYNNLFIKYLPKISEEPQTTWETHLDTATNFKPALVENHYTGKNEIFVQDLNNKIYLINKAGRVLWEKQIDEHIMSDIYQIDYYKNGKLQMLFNTKNNIHLIARNGNYVEKYPVRLPSPATAPLSVFDYENNKNYRIFVPCENKRVYDFSKEGNIITGWQFNKTDTEVTQRVQHFRIGTRDYIVFADQYQIYILNRRGQVRVQPEKQFSRSKNNLFTLETKNSRTRPRLVTTDVTGTVYYIYFDGEVETTELNTFSPDHHFQYRDMDGDGFKDLIFMDNNKLEVYQSKNNKLFEYSFEGDISYSPIYFYFSDNDRKLGVVSKQKNQIYLLNSNGEMHRGFPLKGNAPFSIGYLDQENKNFHLIVGDQTNFLYNYNLLR